LFSAEGRLLELVELHEPKKGELPHRLDKNFSDDNSPNNCSLDNVCIITRRTTKVSEYVVSGGAYLIVS
jgi:hypothetical protein